MANKRGIVSGFDKSRNIPKGVVSPAELRNSLSMVASHEGIIGAQNSRNFTCSDNSMDVIFSAETLAIKDGQEGWYIPTIGRFTQRLEPGHSVYDRIDSIYVVQHDYQVDNHDDSEVEVIYKVGPPSISPSPARLDAPNALRLVTIRVPKNTQRAIDIPRSYFKFAPATGVSGSIIYTHDANETLDVSTAFIENKGDGSKRGGCFIYQKSDNGLYFANAETPMRQINEAPTIQEMITTARLQEGNGWWSRATLFKIGNLVIMPSANFNARSQKSLRANSGWYSMGTIIPAGFRPKHQFKSTFSPFTGDAVINNVANIITVQSDGVIQLRPGTNATINTDGYSGLAIPTLSWECN